MATSRTGQGGKSFQDREQAARVRTLALAKIEKILKGKKTRFQEAVILKLAGTVLPRLNEVTGEDGGPIKVDISKPLLKVYGSNGASTGEVSADS